MKDTLAVLKALADEKRLRVLYALRGGELCVCQIIALLGLAPSTVSNHLAILHAARLAQSRKDGRWVHYRLSEKFLTPAVGMILIGLFNDLEKTERFAEDRRLLKEICGESIESLCQRLFSKT